MASERELVDLRTVTRTRPVSPPREEAPVATGTASASSSISPLASETTSESTRKETMEAAAPSGNWSSTSARGAVLEEEEHERVPDDALEDDDLDHECAGVGGGGGRGRGSTVVHAVEQWDAHDERVGGAWRGRRA